MICHKCGKYNLDVARFCEDCGAPLVQFEKPGQTRNRTIIVAIVACVGACLVMAISILAGINAFIGLNG